MCAGYFQPEAAQSGCLTCDSLGDFYQVRFRNRFSRVRLRNRFSPGDFYQDSLGETSCRACPATTQRYFGLVVGANRTACQCKAGDVSVAVAALGPIRNTSSRPSMQATMIEMDGRARCVTLDAVRVWPPQCASSMELPTLKRRRRLARFVAHRLVLVAGVHAMYSRTSIPPFSPSDLGGSHA